ncbi:MAG: hypothetical protein RIB60_11330 [Phycisphaerales bacterium]
MSRLGDGDRDERGRFLPGNGGGPGNPHGGQVARLRAALLDQVSADDLRDIVRAMVVRAKGGDMAAAKELLNRVLGRPAAAPTPPDENEERQVRIVFTKVDTPPMESD